MPFGSLSVILFGGVLLRLLLIGYGEWQDKAFDLQYTDIDYSVFSDAAAHVYKVSFNIKEILFYELDLIVICTLIT